MKYSYLEAVKQDLREVIADNDYYLLGMDRNSVEEWLNEDAWTNDSVTGNASGSYTFNSYRAKEYIMDNMDLLFDALDEFCYESEQIGKLFKEQSYETMDCIIRLYLLPQAIYEVCDELEENGYFDAQEEEEEEEEQEAAAAAAGC